MAIYNYDAKFSFKMIGFDILTTNFEQSKHQTRIRTIYNYDEKWTFNMDIMTQKIEQSKQQNLCGGGHVCA